MRTDVAYSRRLAIFCVAVLLCGCAAQQQHRRGMAAMEKGDYPAAVQALGQASSLTPGDVEYRRDWLRAREEAGNRLLLSASTAVAAGAHAKAESAYREILKFDADNARAQAGLARLAELIHADADTRDAKRAMKEGEPQRALELASAALRRVPGHAEAQALKTELEAQQQAAQPQVPRLGAIYRKPINLEFRDVSIKLVFDALSRTTGINFIFDREVKPEQRTTVFLKQTSLDDAIDVILSTSQLEKKVLNASSVLIYPNTQAKQREYQDLMVRAFYLANVEAKQTAAMLKTVLKLKDIYVEDKTNMLVLRESPETVALAEKLIRLQDLEEPEVMLEIEVLEINRSRLLNAGVQWNSQLTVTPLGTTSSIPVNGASTSAMSLRDLRNLNSDSIGITVPSATINLQKTDSDAKLLANPRIRVRDREKAKIMIGDKVPVVTTTSTNTFVTENIQYLDVGLKLEVEPDIHLRDEVGLKIGLEVSSLVSSVKTNNGSQAYQIGTRNFNSALRLKDGETQILAGLINDEDRASGNRVPLLGDFPVLGRLFGSQNDSRQQTEIVLSITPHLIRNIQRQGPGSESFWSGTETTLRDRPLLLRSLDEKSGAVASALISATTGAVAAQAQTPASAPNAPQLAWQAPATVKTGEVVTFVLTMHSAEKLRAGALQLSYDTAAFEFVSIEDGGYFNQGGKASFSKSADATSGRVSVGFDLADGAPVAGSGEVVRLQLKARQPAADSAVSLSAFTPIGAQLSVGRPAMPLVHKITVAP